VDRVRTGGGGAAHDPADGLRVVTCDLMIRR
jgi:hypothetical protein